MNRIEESTRVICENGDLTHDYAINLAAMVDRRNDEIKMLQNKLEIAEKALEEAKEKTALAVNKMCGGNVQRHVFEDTRAAYYAIGEALHQIRE